jgi:hypothetical protein
VISPSIKDYIRKEPHLTAEQEQINVREFNFEASKIHASLPQ